MPTAEWTVRSPFVCVVRNVIRSLMLKVCDQTFLTNINFTVHTEFKENIGWKSKSSKRPFALEIKWNGFEYLPMKSSKNGIEEAKKKTVLNLSTWTRTGDVRTIDDIYGINGSNSQANRCQSVFPFIDQWDAQCLSITYISKALTHSHTHTYTRRSLGL